MEKSAGLLIIKDNKILLCHPTGSPWKNTYSIPKGKIENFDKDKIETAIRETKEETGLEIKRENINEKENVIEYRNKKGKIYKKVYYYLTYLKEENIDCKLQIEEVDWCGFLTKEEAEEKIFWRFKEMLNFLK
jgi:ADP-ribose pyrophosphatase YjhB (NUDIX family)